MQGSFFDYQRQKSMVVDYEYINLIKYLSYLLTNVYPSFSE